MWFWMMYKAIYIQKLYLLILKDSDTFLNAAFTFWYYDGQNSVTPKIKFSRHYEFIQCFLPKLAYQLYLESVGF